MLILSSSGKSENNSYNKNKGLVHHLFLSFGPLSWKSAFSVAKLWPAFPEGWLPGYVACAIAQDPVLKSAPYLVYFSVVSVLKFLVI